MADTAAHLVDRVLPEVPVRQWVLSLPFGLRYRLGYDAPLTSKVLRVFIRAVFASLRRRARGQLRRPSTRSLRCGAVTFIQRFGDALNLNVHFHSLVLDGVYVDGEDGGLRFRPLPPPTDEEVERVARRLARLLERHRLGPYGEADEPDPLAQDDVLLAALYAASVRSRIATGPRSGQGVLRLGDRIDPEAMTGGGAVRCANAGGVSLHADVAVPARDRRRLERRPAPRPTSTCPCVPAPSAKPDAGMKAPDAAPHPRRYTWPELMQRVFAVDVLECPRCRSRMRIIAEIHPPGPTRAILDHLGLPTRAPPPRPAPSELTAGDDISAA